MNVIHSFNINSIWNARNGISPSVKLCTPLPRNIKVDTKSQKNKIQFIRLLATCEQHGQDLTSKQSVLQLRILFWS
jgi:hypothetical protein